MLTIGIDFDGTLVRKVEYPSLELVPLPGAIDAVNALAALGHKLVLCSARYGWYRKVAIDWINENRLPISCPKARLKPACDIYIDDRNFGCDRIDWKEILDKLTKDQLECIM